MWVDHMTDLEQLDIRSQGAPLVNEQEMMHRQAELHSGITDYSSGKESSSDPRAPAAKAMMLLQETNLSINEYVDCMRESIVELAYQIINLYYQYMPRDMKYKVLKDGRDIFTNVSRQDLKARKAEYIMTGTTAEENKYLERTEMIELTGFLMKFPMIAGNDDAVRYLLERVIDKYDIKGMHNVLPSEKEVKDRLIAAQKEAMAQLVDEKIEQRGGMARVAGNMETPPMGGLQ